jgi:hypothetical protein
MRFLKGTIPAAAAVAAALVLSLAIGDAKASTAEVQFTVVDVSPEGTNTVTFDLPESPTPSVSTSNLFTLNDVQETVLSSGNNGNTVTAAVTLGFVNNGFGLESVQDDTKSFFNVEVSGMFFTGSTSDPTFVPGTFTGGENSVTITDISATPLPSTWTMMIAGLLGLGFVAFRARKTASTGLASV